MATENPYTQQRRDQKTNSQKAGNGQADQANERELALKRAQELLEKYDTKYEILELESLRQYGFIFRPDDGPDIRVVRKFGNKAQQKAQIQLKEDYENGIYTESELYEKGLSFLAETLVEPSIQEYESWSDCLWELDTELLALVGEKAKEAARKKW